MIYTVMPAAIVSLSCWLRLLLRSAQHRRFGGHIGGDDFMVVFDTDAAEPLCHTIIREFERNLKPFYPKSM